MKQEKRYFVFSKLAAVRTGKLQSLKNATTRQEARDFKNWKDNPSIFGIYDRVNKAIVH